MGKSLMSDDAPPELGTSGKALREVSTVLVLVALAGAAGYWAGHTPRAPAPSVHARPSANTGTTDERLQAAAAEDDADAVRELLAQGVNPCRGTGTLHVTPLHDAAANADANLIRRLLAAGVDPNARTVQGETPLMYLSRSNAVGDVALRALLDGGADLSAIDGKGMTALDRAERQGDAPLAQLLTRAGARPSERPPLFTAPSPPSSLPPRRVPPTSPAAGRSPSYPAP